MTLTKQHSDLRATEVTIVSSLTLTFLNNNVFDFVKYGINVDTSKNVTIDGNWVVAIFSRHLKL